MAIRIEPSKTFTQVKNLYTTDDFSGGLNVPGSSADIFSNQGAEYLNGEFKYDNWFSKRGGFEEVKLCEGIDPLATGKKLVGVYNDLPDEHTIKDGWKIRPYEFIILDSVDNTSNITTREVWYYKHSIKTYEKCKFNPIKPYYGTEKYGYDFRAIRTSNINDIKDSNFFSHVESRDFNWFKIGKDTIELDLKWSYLPSFKSYKQDDYTFFINKDDLYLKISNGDLRTNDESYLLRLKDRTKGLFETSLPYYTSTKEEEVLGWNLRLVMWRYLPSAHQTAFKNFLKWGDSKQTINSVANILSSNFSFLPDEYKSTQNSTVRGYRTDYKGAMPGNKIMNTYGMEEGDDIIFEWWDTIRDNVVLLPPVDKQSVKGDIDDELKEAPLRYTHYNNYSNFFTNQGIATKLKDTDWVKLIKKNSSHTYGQGTNNYASWYGSCSSSVTLGGVSGIPCSLSNSINTLLKWDQAVENSYNAWLTANPISQITSTTYTNELVLALENKVTARYNYSDYAKFSIYDTFTPARLAGIVSQATETKRGAEFSFTDDADLFKAQHVSLGRNDDAYVDMNNIEDLMKTSNVFTYQNSVGYITPHRLFFSMPQEPNMVPHNWDYTPPLLSSQDELQGTTTLYNKLILFSKNQIFSFKGSSPSIAANDNRMILQNLNASLGAYAKNSIKPISQAVVFLSKSGVRKLHTTFASEGLINTKIIDGQISKLTEDLQEIDREAQSTYFNNQYYLFLPSKNNIFVCNVDKGAASKGSWTQWSSPLIDMNDKDKYFYGFYPSNRTQELLLAIGGKLYLKTEDQWYDGSPKASEQEVENGLYDVIFKSQELDLGKPLHKKKFKAFQLQAYVPNDKGAEFYVDINVGGFNILSSNKEVKEVVDGKNVTILKPFPNLKYDAGSWQNIEGIYDLSKTGYDKTPKATLNISGKGETIQVKLRNKSNKQFVILVLGIIFKYKGSK